MKKIVGGILFLVGVLFLLMAIFFGKNPSPSAYGLGEAIVIYFIPLVLVITGTVLLARSNKT